MFYVYYYSTYNGLQSSNSVCSVYHSNSISNTKLTLFGGVRDLQTGFWIECRDLLQRIQLLTALHKQLHDTLSSLPRHFRLSTQETSSIVSHPALHPRHMATGRNQPKTQFPNSSSVLIEVCLPRRCTETEVLPLLRACSFQHEPVYPVVA
jgi:hypothetical protein